MEVAQSTRPRQEGSLYQSFGSCNGLVCVSLEDVELEVTNPWTRESKKLQTPTHRPDEILYTIRQVMSCLGFGYDATTDDYKVIIGLKKRVFDELTVFHVLTLKSNVWKVIGEVKYKDFTNKAGILCGGALYWFMTASKKKVIMSLDLSTEECKEIPQPMEPEYVCADFYDYRLGVIEECLCIYSIFSASPLSSKIWVMKNNKWELYNNESKYDIVHYLARLYSQNRSSYFYSHDDCRLVPSDGDHIRASIFVKSLVSPQAAGGYEQMKTLVPLGQLEL
ncbi:hypothetical protein L1987_59136 [Smallanthus sonchifolius]|uniref:Uncharacterized protein n=1 Tax=Smallanthus sonchifolius TaxID=185202 RepID=A0ACB9D596_9ASTR|nr:hypothetical protein L1987_59136 [Smallanthus sonchifolius]